MRFFLAVAQRKKRIHHVARPLLRRGADLRELAFQLEKQPLRRFLPDARDARQAPSILERDRLREVGDRKPGEDRERGAGADAGGADELAERRALFERRESIPRVRILAHDEMRVERHRIAGRGQAVEGAHRHVDLVANARDVDEHLRRILGHQPSAQPPDHPSLPLLRRRPLVEIEPSCAPCAWQMAQASASAASGEGSPGSASRRRTMCWTCSLRAWPLPTTDCFTCTAAQIAVPRAWPSARVDCGLTLTNTFSTATSSGPCAAMIWFRPSRIALRRCARAPSPDFTQPLVT